MKFKDLVPWKKRRGNGSSAMRGDEPTRVDDQCHPIARLRGEFDSLMHRFFDDRMFGDRMFGDRALGDLSRLWDSSQANGNWDLGWEDQGKEYTFHAKLPGFEPDDIDVTVSGNVLTVRAEHKNEEKEKNGSSYRYGSFSRSCTMPHGVDEAKMDARYHSGVLVVHLPKSKDIQAKRIEVKSA